MIRPLGSELYRQARCKTLILKMGGRGLITFRAPVTESPERRQFFVMDSFASHVVDAMGSGDALLAYATLAMKATGNEIIASALGSLAASVECEKDGNIMVSPDDVRRKLQDIENHANYSY